MYKSVVVDYASKTKKMALAIAEKANEKAEEGWELVTFSVTDSGKAILIFRAPENAPVEEAEPEEEDAPKTMLPGWIEETVSEAE